MSDSFEKLTQMVTIEFQGPKGWEISDALPVESMMEVFARFSVRIKDRSVAWRITVPERVTRSENSRLDETVGMLIAAGETNYNRAVSNARKILGEG